MRNNPVPFYSTFQPSLSYRLRHSRVLKASGALLGVVILVLAAALVLAR